MQYLTGGDIAQLQVDEETARRRQQQAQQLIQAGYSPVQGGNPLLAMLASVMSTVKGNSMLKDSDAKLSETLAKRFEYENQQSQAKAEAEQRKRDEDYQRELDKIGYTKEVEAKYREPSKIDPLSAEGIAATLGLERAKAGMRPGPGPSESDRKIQQLRALGATDDQIRGMLLGNQGNNVPSGYRATATGALEPIPGGPADPAAQAAKPRQLPADMAGRVALAEEYLANSPEINAAIKSGALTGIFDSQTAKAGYGKSGEVYRKIQSGRDALQRTLTGAGMPASEAAEYADRYLPTVGDTQESLASKQSQLQAELGRFIQEARGPGGAPQAPQGAPVPGSVQGGYRFKGGNPADPNAWEPVS